MQFSTIHPIQISIQFLQVNAITMMSKNEDATHVNNAILLLTGKSSDCSLPTKTASALLSEQSYNISSLYEQGRLTLEQSLTAHDFNYANNILESLRLSVQ